MKLGLFYVQNLTIWDFLNNPLQNYIPNDSGLRHIIIFA